MTGKWMFRLGVCALLAAVWPAAEAQAVPPWEHMFGGNSVEADPAKPYTLKEEYGPWMIMACSFSGPEAEKQAHQLVLELRKNYRLEAYVHKAQFKLDDPNGPNAKQRAAANTRLQYKRFEDHPDLYKDGAIKEVAVLVGNYPTVDDPEAQKILQKLKVSEPDCLKIEKGTVVSRPLAALRAFQKATLLPSDDRKKHGPMGHAFVTTNPLLPPDYLAPKGGIDELVLRINRGVTHSLLDCPGRYTVQVAHFTGDVSIDQAEILAVRKGLKEPKSKLAEAAEKAHTLTEALRLKGYEAYEFHDRYESIVTVGSFNTAGTPRADGKIEINPAMHLIMQRFGAMPVPNQPPGAMKVTSLLGISFDIQPIPVEVPKRSISRELARRLDPGDDTR